MLNFRKIFRSLMHSTLLLIWGVLGVGMLASCSPDDSEYCHTYACYFTFNTNFHNTSVILGCVNPLSSGQWCMVSQKEVNSVRHIIVSMYNKSDEDNAITTAQESYQSCILGAENGLIIGSSTLNDGQLYAFDKMCPNCLDESVYKALQWDNSGLWVKCPRCKRSYDLNNSGYVVSGDTGNKLLRYRASFDGTYLRVGN